MILKVNNKGHGMALLTDDQILSLGILMDARKRLEAYILYMQFDPSCKKMSDAEYETNLIYDKHFKS